MKRIAIKSKIGVNIFFLPKAFRKNFEIEKFQDDGVDQLQSISTMHGKKCESDAGTNHLDRFGWTDHSEASSTRCCKS